MSQRYWKIEGYDSTKRIYEKKIPIWYIGEVRIKVLLKCLSAKAGLNFDEIVGAYARKNSRISNTHLHVMRDGPYPTYFCGSNPTFTARIINE